MSQPIVIMGLTEYVGCAIQGEVSECTVTAWMYNVFKKRRSNKSKVFLGIYTFTYISSNFTAALVLSTQCAPCTQWGDIQGQFLAIFAMSLNTPQSFAVYTYAKRPFQHWWLQFQNVSQLWKTLKMLYTFQDQIFSQGLILYANPTSTATSPEYEVTLVFTKWLDYICSANCFKVRPINGYHQKMVCIPLLPTYRPGVV